MLKAGLIFYLKHDYNMCMHCGFLQVPVAAASVQTEKRFRICCLLVQLEVHVALVQYKKLEKK